LFDLSTPNELNFRFVFCLTLLIKKILGYHKNRKKKNLVFLCTHTLNIRNEMTSIMFGYVCAFVYFVLVISAQSIYEIENETYDQRTEILLANYRHRFDHSMNLRKLRWTLENQSKKNKAYCDFCNLVVPVVENCI